MKFFLKIFLAIFLISNFFLTKIYAAPQVIQPQRNIFEEKVTEIQAKAEDIRDQTLYLDTLQEEYEELARDPNMNPADLIDKKRIIQSQEQDLKNLQNELTQLISNSNVTVLNEVEKRVGTMDQYLKARDPYDFSKPVPPISVNPANSYNNNLQQANDLFADINTNIKDIQDTAKNLQNDIDQYKKNNQVDNNVDQSLAKQFNPIDQNSKKLKKQYDDILKKYQKALDPNASPAEQARITECLKELETLNNTVNETITTTANHKKNIQDIEKIDQSNNMYEKELKRLLEDSIEKGQENYEESLRKRIEAGNMRLDCVGKQKCQHDDKIQTLEADAQFLKNKYVKERYKTIAGGTQFDLNKLGIVKVKAKNIESIAANIIRFLARIIGIFAVFSIMVGGLMMIVSTGNETLQSKGKKMILYSILGIVCALSAYVIVTGVEQILYKLGD